MVKPQSLTVAIVALLLSLFSEAFGDNLPTESEQCLGCHPSEVKAWQSSHHFFAMQEATAQFIQGDFSNTLYQDESGWTRFYQQNGGYFIETGKPNQQGESYPVKYTFGVEPLQQILVDIGQGRLQAYTVAWDSRSKAEGGQRWYNLYQNTHEAESPFYWKGQFNNWNARCAQCHSTGLQRHYEVESDHYQTTWKAINVSCESCHGNANRHIELKKNNLEATHSGFESPLNRRSSWVFEEGNPTAVLANKGTVFSTQGLLDECAACHSRRISLIDGEERGQFSQHFIPRLAIPELYHLDGQIRDEVYVYGSFTQSKMSSSGVSCTHCHDSHTAKVFTLDNALCAQCHLPTEFDTQAHTLHKENTSGSQCIDCHMPYTTYMGVDNRRDHAFRVPNPWVSEAFGNKDVCVECHTDKNSQWSQMQLEQKREAIFGDFSDIGPAVLLNQQQPKQGQANIRKWVRDLRQPEMRRAVLVTYLDVHQADNLETLFQLSSDPSYLVKLAVLQVLERADFAAQVQIGFGLLYDENKNVRLEAIQLLAPALRQSIPQEARAPLEEKLRESIATYQAQQDLLSAQLALGDLAYKVGNIAQAKVQYENAIQIEPAFLPAKVNLASILRESGELKASKSLLHQVLDVEPNQALALFNLGLVHILESDIGQAVALLEKASDLEPENTQYGLTYLLALERKGEKVRALLELERLKVLTPNDPVLMQLDVRLNQSQ